MIGYSIYTAGLRVCTMRVQKQNMKISVGNEDFLVSLKWLRGSGRYNNGATRFKNKYLMRMVMSRAKDSTAKIHSIQKLAS